MSAYIVEKEHILYLVSAGLSRLISPHQGPLTWYHDDQHYGLPAGDYKRAAEVANMLWQENAKSYIARYPQHARDAELSAITARDFSMTFAGHSFDPAQIFKSCDCYEYQSCEHEGWKASEAHSFIQRLRKAAWSALPGYESTEWGAPKQNRKAA